MKTTEQMVKEKIWITLHDHTRSEEDSDIIVFGIPFDGGVSVRSGAKDAPATIRANTYTPPPSTEYFEDISYLKVKDIGDFNVESRDKLFDDVRKKVKNLVSKDKFFTMIGGDHSVTIPVLKGIDDALDESFGIIHIDSHFDLCDTLNDDSLSHGCTQRRAVELTNVESSENLFFLGICSVQPDELEFIQSNEMNIINAHDLGQLGVSKTVDAVKEKMAKYNKIYLTIDIDVLDTFGTGTPQIGGPTNRQLLDLLRGLFDLPIIGFDVVEVAPNLDPSMESVFIARRLITECWGHYGRKMNK